MRKPTGVSRRLLQCMEHLEEDDFEGALVNLFSALDPTAKRRRPKEGVAKRIKAFLEDEERLMSSLTGNCLSNIKCNDLSITDTLYKFGRTSIVHEGELDPRIEFNCNGTFSIGSKKLILPSSYIVGMSVAVITAPENSNEYIDVPFSIIVFEKSFNVAELWGNAEAIKGYICEKFKNKELFS